MLFRDILTVAASQTSGVAGYDSDAVAYFAAMSSAPNDTRKGLLNTLIVGLKSDGVWSLLDWISILAAHDEQASRVNAKNPAQVASVVNSPVFTADRGYLGVFATTSYLDCGVADNAGGNSVQDSSTLFAWCNVLPVSSGSLIGTVTGAAHRIVLTAATSRNYRVHGATGSLTTVVAPATGLYAASRSSSTAVAGYYNGASDGTASPTSTAPVAANLSFLNGGGQIADARIAAGGWGASLDATQQTALYNRLNTYLTAVGGA